ncbi:MAG: hypothetical protein LCH67_17120 [Bacteroidetes bacterium]|nr:hypothetical protein [Bacteroidota bacterium]
MKKVLIIIIFLSIIHDNVAQSITITPSGIMPAQYSKFEKLTFEQIQAKTGMQNGDAIFDNTFNCLRIYNGHDWLRIQQPLNTEGEQTSMSFVCHYADIAAVATDSQNNVYIGGGFTDSLVLSPTVTLHTLIPNASGIFVAKFSSSGTLLNYNSPQFSNSFVALTDLILDLSGNVIICGAYIGTVNWGGVTSTSSQNDGYDSFVVKYNNSLAFQWAKAEGGPNTDFALNIASDASNIYIAGYYYDSFSLNSGALSVPTNGDSDIYLAKISDAGTAEWLTHVGGVNFDYPNDLLLNVNSIYLTGLFSNSMAVGPDTLISNGDTDFFVGLFDTAGNTVNGLSGGGPGSDEGKVLLKDSNQNLYMAGNFNDSLTIGTQKSYSNGGQDMFFCRIIDNSVSNARIRSTNFYIEDFSTFGSIDPSINDYINGGIADNNQNIYISGYTGAVISIDGYSTAIDNGGFLWRRNTQKGTTGLFPIYGDASPCIAKDLLGNIYASNISLTSKTLGSTYYSVTANTNLLLLTKLRID